MELDLITLICTCVANASKPGVGVLIWGGNERHTSFDLRDVFDFIVRKLQNKKNP